MAVVLSQARRAHLRWWPTTTRVPAPHPQTAPPDQHYYYCYYYPTVVYVPRCISVFGQQGYFL